MTSTYLVGQQVDRLQGYVHRQLWSDSVRDDIPALRITLERVFSPTVLAEYEAEREADIAETGAERVDIPGPVEPGAADVPLGYFHRGLLSNLASLAAARLKVDQDERLTIGEIALLTRKRDATVTTTAYRKVFPTYEENGKRYAEVTDVLPWLVANGYEPTLGIDYHDTPDAAYASAEEYTFVPLARDGSAFTPSCASGGRFTIGERGTEQKFDDYFEALEALQRMPTPRWRRPGPAGVSGIVTGVRFERMTRRQLESA